MSADSYVLKDFLMYLSTMWDFLCTYLNKHDEEFLMYLKKVYVEHDVEFSCVLKPDEGFLMYLRC